MTFVPSAQRFESWKTDIDELWDRPMKERVYPAGLKIPGVHSYFVDERGTWFRRLGSYAIQIIERGATVPVGTSADITVTGHAARVIYGARSA